MGARQTLGVRALSGEMTSIHTARGAAVPGYAGAVRASRALATVAGERWGRAAPDERGRLAEALLAERFGWALWHKLPAAWRCAVSGSGGRDRGADLVGVTTAGPSRLGVDSFSAWGCAPKAQRGDAAAPRVLFVQVKWLAPGARIGHDPVARLVSLREHYRRRFGAEVACVVCAPEDVALGDVPNADAVRLVRLPRCLPAAVVAAQRLWRRAVSGGRAPAGERVPAGNGQSAAADYSFQKEAAARLLAARGRTARCRLPPASGKSYVIVEIARQASSAGLPAVIAAPRVEIVRQLAALARARLGAEAVAVAVGGVLRGWRPAATRAVVACTRSLHCLAPPLVAAGREPRPEAPPVAGANAGPRPAPEWSAVLRDEAHIRGGEAWIRALPEQTKLYEFSATLDSGSEVDYELSAEEVVRRGCACAPEFVFAVHRAEPTQADVCAHLRRHPEYSTVLACFQRQSGAREFVTRCAAAGITAASCVSDDGGDGDAALAEFRAGRLRVLAVVARLEMGVDVHACDTVLFVEPWDSDARTFQLIGRGMRLHPSKNGTFSVLVPVGAQCAKERRLRDLVASFAGCGFACAGPHSGNLNGVALRAERLDAADTVEPVAAPRSLHEDRFDFRGAPVEAKPGLPNAAVGVVQEFGEAIADLFDELIHGYARADAQARYERAREYLRGLGAGAPRSYDEYRALRASLLPGDPARRILPADPAKEFSFRDSPRSWPDLLGLDEGDAKTKVTQAERRAFAVVFGQLKRSGHPIGIRDAAKMGSALHKKMLRVDPLLPPRVMETFEEWTEYFAQLLAG
jgi:superfamily II DNA or RNA helicase